ncbi:Uncharacterised protein [Vibrio cholerae]|nr:Uncharacterised protein [Vibrio cholerae]
MHVKSQELENGTAPQTSPQTNSGYPQWADKTLRHRHLLSISAPIFPVFYDAQSADGLRDHKS